MVKSPTHPSSRDRAVARVREIIGELKVLSAAFPDLHDSFDEDELPVMFLIRRDAARVQPRSPRQGRSVRPAGPTLKRKRGKVKT